MLCEGYSERCTHYHQYTKDHFIARCLYLTKPKILIEKLSDLASLLIKLIYFLLVRGNLANFEVCRAAVAGYTNSPSPPTATHLPPTGDTPAPTFPYRGGEFAAFRRRKD